MPRCRAKPGAVPRMWRGLACSATLTARSARRNGGGGGIDCVYITCDVIRHLLPYFWNIRASVFFHEAVDVMRLTPLRGGQVVSVSKGGNRGRSTIFDRRQDAASACPPAHRARSGDTWVPGRSGSGHQALE